MKILVTGGGGFIGSHIAEVALARGHDVLVVDDLSTGRNENLPRGVMFWEGKIQRYEGDFVPDVIFHCAARASIPESVEDPVGSNEENVRGTLAVLEIARRTGARVVLSSSSSVYGQAGAIPLSEDSPLDPLQPYALQKRISEMYAEMYYNLYGVNVVALRYFNVFGERQESANGGYALVLSKFLKQKQDGEPFTVVGTGEQTRDFVYVKDVVDANFRAAGFDGFDVFNVGSGVERSVNDLARLIDEGRPKIYLPPRIEPMRLCANTSKAKRVLGWEPKVSLEEWLKK